jgi:hypothetical protein
VFTEQDELRYKALERATEIMKKGGFTYGEPRTEQWTHTSPVQYFQTFKREGIKVSLRLSGDHMRATVKIRNEFAMIYREAHDGCWAWQNEAAWVPILEQWAMIIPPDLRDDRHQLPPPCEFRRSRFKIGMDGTVAVDQHLDEARVVCLAGLDKQRRIIRDVSAPEHDNPYFLVEGSRQQRTYFILYDGRNQWYHVSKSYSVVWPEAKTPRERFELTTNDRRLLRRAVKVFLERITSCTSD